MNIGGTLSDLLEVKSSVPRGSVLASLLFLLYINDLPDFVGPQISVRMFADDGLLFLPASSTEDLEHLNINLHRGAERCSLWDTVVNPEKTVLLSIKAKKNPLVFAYNVGDTAVTKVSECKCLEVTITDKLS